MLPLIYVTLGYPGFKIFFVQGALGYPAPYICYPGFTSPFDYLTFGSCYPGLRHLLSILILIHVTLEFCYAGFMSLLINAPLDASHF